QRASLLEDVDAEAPQSGHAVGQVDLVAVLEPLALVLVHDPEGHARHLLGWEALAVLQGDQRAIHPEHRGKAGLEVDVARPAAERDLEDLVDSQALPSLAPPVGSPRFLCAGGLHPPVAPSMPGRVRRNRSGDRAEPRHAPGAANPPAAAGERAALSGRARPVEESLGAGSTIVEAEDDPGFESLGDPLVAHAVQEERTGGGANEREIDGLLRRLPAAQFGIEVLEAELQGRAVLDQGHDLEEGDLSVAHAAVDAGHGP